MDYKCFIIPQIQSCCCCCSLKNGTLALLLLNLGLYGLVFAKRIPLPVDYDNIIEWYYGILLLTLWFSAKLIGIYGLLTKKPNFLVPYMITQMISLIVYGLIIILLFIAVFLIFFLQQQPMVMNGVLEWEAIIILIAVFIVLFAFQYYFILVVYSTFRRMKTEANLLYGNFNFDAPMVVYRC